MRWVNFGAERMTTDDGGPVLEVQQNRKFAFQWQPGRVATTVSFELETRGAGTLVRMQESGHSMDDVETAVYCAAGWGEALTLLKIWLEHGVTCSEVPAR